MNWMTWLRGFSIRARLVACVVLVVGIGLSIGGVMSLQLHRIQGEFDSFSQKEFGATQEMARLSLLMGQLRGHEKTTLIHTGDGVSGAEAYKRWKAALVTTKAQVQKVVEAAPNDALRTEAKGLSTLLENYANGMTPTFELIQANAISSVSEAYQSCAASREDAEKMDTLTAHLAAEIREVADQHRTEVAQAARRATVVLWVLLLAPGIIFLPLMALTVLSITRPLGQAQQVTAAIAQGDLTRQLDTSGRDEMASLLRSLADMQHGLRAMVSAVRVSSDGMLTASSEIAAGNQDLSNRTEQTAANLQTTASSMDQLSKTVEQAAESAQTANQLAEAASQRAAQGGEVVHSAVARMGEISQASKQIADIIGVIDGIAFQTNILALNAAVEAARAGEQGRGFAVVAGEVRQLAQRSANAAREIKGLIQQSVERIDLGADRVREAGQVMEEIVVAISRVTQSMGDIAGAAQQQSEGIGLVTHSVNELDQMTQQNAALVEQSAAAAASLRQQAADLAQSVQRFRTDSY